MNTSWRLIRAQARNDGTLHTCWHCGRSIAHGSLCMTRDEKRPDRSLVRLYAHDGCHNTEAAA